MNGPAHILVSLCLLGLGGLFAICATPDATVGRALRAMLLAMTGSLWALSLFVMVRGVML